jgi:hypothetical protein
MPKLIFLNRFLKGTAWRVFLFYHQIPGIKGIPQTKDHKRKLCSLNIKTLEVTQILQKKRG